MEVGLLFCNTRFLRNLTIHGAIELRFELTSIIRFCLLIVFFFCGIILHMLKTKFFSVNHKGANNICEFPTFLPSKKPVQGSLEFLLG